MARTGLLKRDPSAETQLPYARHVTDTVVALDSGALVMSFRLSGASFETADIGDLNDWHGKLNGAWRNLADDRLAVWHHLVRREQAAVAPGGFRSGFAAELDAAYRARLGGERMFVNELYLTLVLHPGRGAAERASGLASRGCRAARGSPPTQAADLEAAAGRGARPGRPSRPLQPHRRWPSTSTMACGSPSRWRCCAWC